MAELEEDLEGRVAVIGMAGRFPGAATSGAFWRNLRDGVESITVFTDEELLAAGWSVEPRLPRPGLRARPAAVLADVELFDAGVLRLQPARGGDHRPAAPPLPRSAPGRRSSDAGYDPATASSGPIGVFAGVRHATPT